MKMAHHGVDAFYLCREQCGCHSRSCCSAEPHLQCHCHCLLLPPGWTVMGLQTKKRTHSKTQWHMTAQGTYDFSNSNKLQQFTFQIKYLKSQYSLSISSVNIATFGFLELFVQKHFNVSCSTHYYLFIQLTYITWATYLKKKKVKLVTVEPALTGWSRLSWVKGTLSWKIMIPGKCTSGILVTVLVVTISTMFNTKWFLR